MLFKRLFSCLLTTLSLSSPIWSFTNPIKPSHGADPFMVFSDGYYYLMTTGGSKISITRAESIAALKDAEPKEVWRDDEPSRCCDVWAPEIHYMPDEQAWFIYYSAGPGGDSKDGQRAHALKGTSDNIWDSSWTYAGRLFSSNRDEFAIDGSILVVNDKRYFVYSSWDGPSGDREQCLFISPMENATALGNTVKISRPSLEWERAGPGPVNEGPAAIYHENKTWIVFSASHCHSDGYKLGQLELTGNGDPVNPTSWSKKPTPIFVGANGQFQPGHNGFFKSPSGQEWWIVYHADSYVPSQCNEDRHTSVQPINFTAAGELNLGEPLPLSQDIPEPN